MRLLLDTHAIIWFYRGDVARLSATARQAMESEDNEIFVSAVNFWEMAIKISLGKLRLPGDLADVLHRFLDAGATALDISPEHGIAVQRLPLFDDHKDPFDRLLIAQAIIEDMPLVSNESSFDRYSVRRVWRDEGVNF